MKKRSRAPKSRKLALDKEIVVRGEPDVGGGGILLPTALCTFGC